jgi:hypothetical protein
LSLSALSASGVVSLGHCETLRLKDCFWQIGGTYVKDVPSYTYLGIKFDKLANWLLEALCNNVEKCRQSTGHLYSLTDDPDQGLEVGHLAEIWGLFARSRLLFGSEIWSAPSASALESLEVAQTMAGRQILGKPGNSNISREALYDKLGWLSIRSYLRLTKLCFFGCLLCLPNDPLPKCVFLLSAARFDSCRRLKPLFDLPDSWCKDTFTILCELSLQSWWSSSIPFHLASSLAFKRTIKSHVSKLDQLERKAALNEPAIAQTELSAHKHYKRLKEQKSREPYLYTGDRKSALFKFYLRSRTFGLDAQIQHGDSGPLTDARKAFSLCDFQ